MNPRVVFVLSLLCFSRLAAQQLDNPITVPVTMYGSAVIGWVDGYFKISVNSAYVEATHNNAAYGATYYTSTTNFDLVPGVDYTVWITSSGCSSVTAHIKPMAGQDIYIEGEKRTEISLPTQNQSAVSFKLRVEMLNDITSSVAGLRGGECSSFVEDKPIWFIGLGALRSGGFAGALGIRRSTISSDLFTTASLIYHSSGDPEVTVTRSAGHITRIVAPDVQVEVDAYNSSSTSYDIRVFSPFNLSTPFITYTVKKHIVTGGDGIRIDKVENGVRWATVLQKVGAVWTRYDWQRVASGTSALSNTNAVVTTVNGATSTMSYGSGALVKEKTFVGGELSTFTVGAGSSVAQTTTYDYYTGLLSFGWNSTVKSVVEPTGNWKKYDYYTTDGPTGAAGQIHRIYKPWKDAPSSPANASLASGYVETYQYEADEQGRITAPASRTITINGAMAGLTEWDYNYSYSSANGLTLKQTVQRDYTAAGAYLTTTTLLYTTPNGVSYYHDKPYSVTYPDGRKESYAYFDGNWDPATRAFTYSAASGASNPDRLIFTYRGQQNGGTAVTAASIPGASRSIDSVSMVDNVSTVGMKVIDRTGRVVFTGDLVYASGTLSAISGTHYSVDSHRRPSGEQDAFRTALSSSTTYAASSTADEALTETVTKPDGVVDKIHYDAFKRLSGKVVGHGGNSEFPAKEEETTYNAAGLPEKTYSCSCGTSPVVFSYDAAGRITHKYEKSPGDPDNDSAGSLVTTFEYPSARSRKTTFPNGSTKIEEFYLDGRLKSITGTAQPPVFYDYSVSTGGVVTTTAYNASSADRTYGFTETTTDWLGRTVQHSTPAFNYSSTASNNVIDVVSTYSSTTGLLTKQTTTYRNGGGRVRPDRLLTYDGAGNVELDGFDLNENSILDAGANDRITKHARYFWKDSGSTWWAVAKTSTYAALNSNAETVLEEVRTRLTGFGSGEVGQTVSIDASGRITTKTDSVDPSQKRATSTTSITGVSNSAYHKLANGYDYETQDFSGERIERKYDSLGRLSTVRSRWNGGAFSATDSYTYHGKTSYVSSLTSGGVTTTYGYSWTSGSRTVSTTTAGSTSYVTYNAMDLPAATYGSGATPSLTGYDGQGRRTSLTTFKSNSYDGATAPSSTTGGDTTTWTPDAATGLIKKKTYADGNDVEFTYTPLGQIATRINARNVTATYTYYDGSGTATGDVSHRTQELKSVTYNDGITPSVTYTYRRSGALAGVNDGVTGSRVFSYGASDPYLVTAETFGSFYNISGAARVRTLTYDGHGRPTGFKLGTAANDDLDLTRTRTYVPGSGLVHQVISYRGDGSSPRTFTYAYEANSHRVDTYSAGSFTADFDHDATSAGRRTKVESRWNSTILTQFELKHDNRGFVQSAKQSGTAFSDYYAGTTTSSVYNFHVYDLRGQLQTTAMFRGAPPTSGSPPSGDELPGRRFEYRYDAMGNRTSSGPTGTTSSIDNEYTLKPNGLNQYHTKENNTLRILGTAAPGSVVSVTGGLVNKTARNFAADISVLGNASGPAKGSVDISARTSSGAVRSESRDFFIPAQTQTFSYDADGNLDSDGLWDYDFDAENRLIRMTSTLPAGQNFTRLELEFKYDYLGRRVEKKVKDLNTNSVTLLKRFLYDGWNLIAELDSNGSLQRSFTWGLDVTGSLTASGGVGALLQVTEHSSAKDYFTSYDGNGNISSLIRDDGVLVAIYEYSPYGELLRAERRVSNDAVASDNSFLFSTKYTDAETGLIYYGMRYYSPPAGRFINRDPIEESGGLNLYGFVSNSPLSRFDILGMNDTEVRPGMEVTSTRLPRDPFTSRITPNSLGFIQYTLNNWQGGWTGQMGLITGFHNPPPVFTPPEPRTAGVIVVIDPETGRRRVIVIPGVTKEQMQRGDFVRAAVATATAPNSARDANLQTGGVYSMARDVDAPIGVHQFTVLVPRDPSKISTKFQRYLIDIGDGRKGIVIGAYEVGGSLKAELNYKTDREAAQQFFSAGSGSWNPQGYLVNVGENVSVDSYIQRALDFTLNYMINTKTNPIDYPPVVGWGINSNSWNQSIHAHLGGDTIEEDFDGRDIKHELRIPISYFQR